MANNGSLDKFLGRTGIIITIVSAIVLATSVIVTNCIRVSSASAACKALSKVVAEHETELAVLRTKLDTLILGQKEVLDGTILLRDMEGGIQETIDLKKVADDLEKKWLKK